MEDADFVYKEIDTENPLVIKSTNTSGFNCDFIQIHQTKTFTYEERKTNNGNVQIIAFAE